MAQAGDQGEPGCGEKLPDLSKVRLWDVSDFRVCSHTSHPESPASYIWGSLEGKGNSTLPSPDQRQREEERWDLAGDGLKSSQTCSPGVRQSRLKMHSVPQLLKANQENPLNPLDPPNFISRGQLLHSDNGPRDLSSLQCGIGWFQLW